MSSREGGEEGQSHYFQAPQNKTSLSDRSRNQQCWQECAGRQRVVQCVQQGSGNGQGKYYQPFLKHTYLARVVLRVVDLFRGGFVALVAVRPSSVL